MPRRAPSSNIRRLAAAVALASWPTPAAAATPTAAPPPAPALPLELHWTAPPECPTGAEVKRELTRITRVREGRTLVALTARAVVVRDARGYRLTLELDKHGQVSTAHFDDETCAPLLEATTLVLALAFGDGVELSGSNPTEPPPPELTPPAAATPRSAPPPAPRPPARLQLAPWAGAVASSGFIGRAALGADVGLGIGGTFWAIFGRASAFTPSRAAERGGVSADLSAMLGAVGACGRQQWQRVRVDACLGLDAGVVRAHSSGAEHDGSSTAPWFAVSPSLGALLPLPRPFALRAELALAMPFAAARYDVEPLGTLYATSRLIPRGSLGIAVEL